MPVIAPFRGIRYNLQKVGDLNQVITQPYDKITPEMRDEYYRRSEYNYARLIQNRDANAYNGAKDTCDRWLNDGTLSKDVRPSMYPYRQIFKINGKTRVRRGLICLCRLEPFDTGRVLPHERTLSKPKEDRLNLMRTTKKQFEQVFMLYADEEDKVNRALSPIWKWTPDFEVTDEYGTTHCLWSVSDRKTIRAIEMALKPKVFVIADGHHRYETALNYRDEMRRKLTAPTGREAFNYRLVTCVNLNDPALVILPTHRCIRGLPEFNVNEFLTRAQKFFAITSKVTLEEIPKYLDAKGARRTRTPHTFVLYCGADRTYALSLKPGSEVETMFASERSPEYRSLDVAILHSVLIENVLGIKPEVIEDHVGYQREWKNALTDVDQGKAQLAFLIRPTRPEQVKQIAENLERMPQKSTDFFPKLISGLVFLDVDEEETIIG